MSSRKWLWAAPLAALVIDAASAQLAHAEPLIPLTPAETQYLDQARRVFAVSQTSVAFRSDGELLSDGHYACDKRAAGFVGIGATFLDPAITQLAFIYLCP